MSSDFFSRRCGCQGGLLMSFHLKGGIDQLIYLTFIERFIFHFHSFSLSSVAAQLCLTLRPHGLQHARFFCPSSTPRAYSNSCLSSRWCHPTMSSSIIPSFFPIIRLFSNESVLHIRWPKYWSFIFSISPSNEYSGLISFRID